MPVKLATLVLLLSSAAAGAQSSVCAQVQALLKDAAVAQAHWGISVATLSGSSLCQVNEAQLFRPASNAKLFTIAAALSYPAPTLDTKITGTLDTATGIVTGDLTLGGAGDANLDSNDLPYLLHRPAHPASLPDLEDLATQLQAAGVTKITGDLVGDDTLYPYEPYPQGWSADDQVWGFGAPVSALTVADNQLRLTATPGVLNGQAALTLEQYGTAYYKLQNDTLTTTARLATGIAIERLAGSRTVRVFGSVAAGSAPDAEEIAIDDPALFAAMALRAILLSRGILVEGTARAQHQPAHTVSFAASQKLPMAREQLYLGGSFINACAQPYLGQTLAVHHASSRAQDIAFTLKASQNLHAELLFHSLGLVAFCRNMDTAQSARLVRVAALHAGVLPGDFLLYDGSGLSTQDLVTPRAFTTLLAWAARQPWFESYKSALPVGGVDGTLFARFTGANNGSLKGNIFAKTGTLGESRALSGYLTAASGRTLVFSILTDTHLPGTPADRAVTDKIVELFAASN